MSQDLDECEMNSGFDMCTIRAASASQDGGVGQGRGLEMRIPEDGASRHNARRKVFAALGARRVPIAHFGVAAAAGAGALVLATRRVLGPILDWAGAGRV